MIGLLTKIEEGQVIPSKQIRDRSNDVALADRLVALASTWWVDPNERCACVTIAIALQVCPEKVSVAPSEFSESDDLCQFSS